MKLQPLVRRGLTEATIGGQQYTIPQAFMDRMLYDASVAYKNVGMPSRERLMNMVYRPPQQGMHVAYRGLDDYLAKMKQKYAGPSHIEMNPLRERTENIWKQYHESKGPRTIKPSGQSVGFNRPTVTRHEGRVATSDFMKAEKKQRADMMRDLHGFKKLGRQRTVANLPVKVT